MGRSAGAERFSPGFRRPVLIVQGDPLNRSRIATVVCVPLTSNLKWAAAPGNVLRRARVAAAAALGGAFFMQLFFDGSEGAICGLAVLVPLGVLGVVAARGRQLRLLVPGTILLSGLFALYPVFLDIAALAAGAALAAATPAEPANATNMAATTPERVRAVAYSTKKGEYTNLEMNLNIVPGVTESIVRNFISVFEEDVEAFAAYVRKGSQ